MILTRTEAELESALAAARDRGARVGLVPTRGALHEGKLSLVDRCRAHADVCVLSLWRDPYRDLVPGGEGSAHGEWDLESDLHSAAERGVALVFAPEGPRARFGASEREVATLLEAARPAWVVVGRADLRWAVGVRDAVRRIDPDIGVDVAPIVRAADGFALSSAGRSLSGRERREALGLVRALELGRRAYADGERCAAALMAVMGRETGSRPLLSDVQMEIVRVEDLAAQDPVGERSAAIIMARCGAVRLLDNMLLSSSSESSS